MARRSSSTEADGRAAACPPVDRPALTGGTKKLGRPSPYTDGFCTSFAELGHKLALLGLRDQDIAAVFGVAESTLSKWKNDYPAFSEALNSGKAPADALVVASLYSRATGYWHEETDIRVIDGAVVQTKVRKHFPPDVTACIFWLKNRQRAQWRDGITVTDETPPMAPNDIARRIAFALALGLQGKGGPTPAP